jgi:hypothetical protein
MSSQLLPLSDVLTKIKSGQPLLLAADESLLSLLPEGNWIGGTIPYFMDALGGCLCKDRIFTTELPDFVSDVRVLTFDRASLPEINTGGDFQDVSVVILPASSGVHIDFALNAPKYKGFATHPVIGWIAGIDLKDLGTAKPKVFGGNSKPLEDAAVVLRFRIPESKYAHISIMNLFQQGNGDVIQFPHSGFSADEVLVNGERCNFADYLTRIGANTKLPLVANYSGASVNVSFKLVDSATRQVEFYAPVWPGTDYKLAAPIGDYVTEFESRLKQLNPNQIVFSCNCILNYLYSGLEGRQTGGIVGPITFGEIAYQLLNQTMACISFEDLG